MAAPFKSSDSFNVDVDQSMVDQFAKLSGDINALHVDEAEAGKTEFKGRVAHGALLLSFVSRFLGMNIPGKGCLITNIDSRFPKPLKPPQTISVTGKLTVYNDQRRDGKVRVEVSSPQGKHVEADVHFMLTALTVKSPQVEVMTRLADAARTRSGNTTNRKKILLTGGTGGLGSKIAKNLAGQYDLVIPTRKEGNKQDGIEYPKIDLSSNDELETLLNNCNPGEFWAVIHMSSPKPRQAQITGLNSDLINQFHHAVSLPVRLCQWAKQNESTVGRVILLGSISGTKQLDISIPGYSLTKGLMNPLAQLLAVEMAGRQCTVNVIAPGFIPLGINEGLPERKQVYWKNLTPTGHLTQPVDIENIINFLLAPESSQINGTTITIDGGQLKP